MQNSEISKEVDTTSKTNSTISELLDLVEGVRNQIDELRLADKKALSLCNKRVDRRPEREKLTNVPRVSRPVFVLGCVRSGTTAVGRALQAAGLPGWTEGHVFPLLHLLKLAIEGFLVKETPNLNAGLGVDFLDQGRLEGLLVDYFEQFQLSQHMSTRWVDKTPGPEMIEAAPYLHSLWPRARFIYCRRRGIENVKSQLRRFSNEPGVNLGFQEACHVWARCMDMWGGVRESLGETFCEIDQGEMATNPEETVARLAVLLELTSTQAEALGNSLRDCHPEQTASSSAPESLEETGWSEEQRNFFLTACGSSMQAYGYSLGVEADAKMQAAILLPFCNDPEKVSLANLDDTNAYSAQEHGAFLLHPKLPGNPPPVVTFRSLSFHGHSHFFAGLELRKSEAPPVLYRMRIQESGGGAVLVDAHCIVQAGNLTPWHLDFPPLMGTMDVSFSTEMAPGSTHNFYAWATWISPRFLIK
jgi:hypothetical protein